MRLDLKAGILLGRVECTQIEVHRIHRCPVLHLSSGVPSLLFPRASRWFKKKQPTDKGEDHPRPNEILRLHPSIVRHALLLLIEWIVREKPPWVRARHHIPNVFVRFGQRVTGALIFFPSVREPALSL